MLKALRKLIDRWLGPAPAPAAAQPDLATLPLQEPDSHLEPSPAAAPHPAPYDEHLFERSRTQWQFGDWDSLARLAPDTLAHHPDRAKLALLAATAHGQLGNTAQCRQLASQALDWGCPKKLVSQVLIAGVHNVLGRATALGNQPQRALRHFEAALATGTPGADLRLLVPTLARHEIQQLGLQADTLPYNTGAEPGRPVPLLGRSIQSLTEQLQKQNTEVAEQLSKQNAELNNLRKHLESTVKKEMLNATQQLEAFLDIQSFLSHGEHLPSMHGWPVSPDFARYLIELLEKNHYDLILEFGSGTSTVVIAKALARINHGRQDKAAVIQVAFEHLPKYHAQTLAVLQTAHLADAVQVVLAPLEPYAAPNGNTYSYYACQDNLAELAKQLPADITTILMVVDGPPGSTGKHARYPALPAVLTHFKNKKIDVVLDDYFRADEKEVGALWQHDFETAGYETTFETIKMEKDACFISGSPMKTSHHTSTTL
ncbi:class I SAM-dependent methyltransferase [Thauera sp.]|uniref:class I SAM-dependent methyltransferase n=1 Tax=Thauera sp. TaxID=1905334 RepID=UPI002627F8CA|nr:class I SAM-dependent methyltransferase [Thauera sp.]